MTTTNLPPHLALDHARRCALKARGPAQLEANVLKVLNNLQAYNSVRKLRSWADQQIHSITKFRAVPHCLFSSNGKLWRATSCEVDPRTHVVALSSNIHGVRVLNCTLAALPHILPRRG